MLNVHGAAQRLGVSKWCVWRLVREGKIPYYRLPLPKGLRFDSFELELWKETFHHGPKLDPKKRKVRK
jgi:excisionase family DNA binding protein